MIGAPHILLHSLNIYILNQLNRLYAVCLYQFLRHMCSVCLDYNVYYRWATVRIKQITKSKFYVTFRWPSHNVGGLASQYQNLGELKQSWLILYCYYQHPIIKMKRCRLQNRHYNGYLQKGKKINKRRKEEKTEKPKGTIVAWLWTVLSTRTFNWLKPIGRIQAMFFAAIQSKTALTKENVSCMVGVGWWTPDDDDD